MTTERTALGREIERALREVLAHVRGEADLTCRIVDDQGLAQDQLARTAGVVGSETRDGY